MDPTGNKTSLVRREKGWAISRALQWLNLFAEPCKMDLKHIYLSQHRNMRAHFREFLFCTRLWWVIAVDQYR